MLAAFAPVLSARFRRRILPYFGTFLAAFLSQSSQLPAQTQPPALPALKVDEALRPAVERSLRIQALRDTRDRSLMVLSIQVDRPPVTMGFDVSMRVGDRTLVVGPVAWSAQMVSWAFDVDVPAGDTTVTLVFTPSAKAAAKLKRQNADRLTELDSIWDGEVVLKGVKVQSLRLQGMRSVAPPGVEEAREDLIEQWEGDDSVIQKFKHDGDLATVRRKLEREVHDHPGNAADWFNLGCLTVAAGDWRDALDCFVKTLEIDPAAPLADKAQRQLRRIGSYFVHGTRVDDTAAMSSCSLGVMYQRGWGPGLDRQEAKKWFRNAANAGNAEALFHLGEMYEQDLAAGQDNPKAKSWYQQQTLEMYQRAAELGNEAARKWVANHDQR